MNRWRILFEQWDKGRLHSYLIEITSAILRHKEEGGDYLLDNILDAAGQKERVAGVSLTPYN